ncbi:MAG: DUF362 domain-containing protein [Gemmatimonadota bacterium]
MSHAHHHPSIPGLKPFHARPGPRDLLRLLDLPGEHASRARSWTRRDFIKTGVSSLALATVTPWPTFLGGEGPVVGIARVRNGDVARAVEEVIDLLGGIETVTAGKHRIMLKPNLVAESPIMTTKPVVIRMLASLMKGAGKEVLIGEGSAAGTGFNVKGGVQYRTKSREILDPMQQYVFDQLGYTDLAKSLHVPLVNLHSGDLVDVDLKGGYVFDHITLHRSLTEVDMLVSVPMMKTHVLATVTLGMKNVIGLYPGTVYYSVRSWLHDHAAAARSPGVAYEIVDMVRANRMGLTVIDASQAMEGNGPSTGDLVDMGLIIAGTDPLATDMVGAATMGIQPAEVPTFAAAWGVGMTPTRLEDIEVRGAPLEQVRRRFKRPQVIPWSAIANIWGVQELKSPLPPGSTGQRRQMPYLM